MKAATANSILHHGPRPSRRPLRGLLRMRTSAASYTRGAAQGATLPAVVPSGFAYCLHSPSYIPLAFSPPTWDQAPSGSLVMTGDRGFASGVSPVRWLAAGAGLPG